jgi:hypothetical protein
VIFPNFGINGHAVLVFIQTRIGPTSFARGAKLLAHLVLLFFDERIGGRRRLALAQAFQKLADRLV